MMARMYVQPSILKPANACHDALASSVMARRRHIHQRQDVLSEGQVSDGACVLMAGWAARYRTLEDGRRQIIAILIPGDVCCLNIVSNSRLQYSVCALTEIDVDTFPGPLIRETMQRGSDFAEALWREVFANIAMQQEWTVNLGRRTAFERMGHLFCELYHRMRQIGAVVDDGFYCPLVQSDLADAVGLTPVHVNRTLNSLRRDNLAILQHRRLVIPDIRRLEHASLFLPGYLSGSA